MKWTNTTREAVDGAWNSNATRVDENSDEHVTLERLRTSRFVQRNVANVMFAVQEGIMPLSDAVMGVLVAALRTGWYVRNDASGVGELAGLLSDTEMVELRKEIANATKSTESGTRMDV